MYVTGRFAIEHTSFYAFCVRQQSALPLTKMKHRFFMQKKSTAAVSFWRWKNITNSQTIAYVLSYTSKYI